MDMCLQQLPEVTILLVWLDPPGVALELFEPPVNQIIVSPQCHWCLCLQPYTASADGSRDFCSQGGLQPC